MEIYCFVDQPNFGEDANDAVTAITHWQKNDYGQGSLVNNNDNDPWLLGITTEVNKAKHLIPLLNGLYKIAKEYKCDFVIGFMDNGEREDVCFFGHEEGKADAFEVGCYLGIG